MRDYKKTAKVSLAVTYILMLLLAVLTVGLPFAVTWYVEANDRSADLAATVMLTCYPCVPFAAVALVSLEKFIKSIIKDTVFEDKNAKNLLYVAVCCLAAGVIMLIAGVFYMPFYVGGGAALFCALVIKVFYDLILKLKAERKEENK